MDCDCRGDIDRLAMMLSGFGALKGATKETTGTGPVAKFATNLWLRVAWLNKKRGLFS